MMNFRKKLEIGHEIKENMVAYAESVILDRAIPHASDGLKPVHRRIIYAMGELGLSPTSKTLKSARIVGEVLGKYHPHGDSSVYGAEVRLAQDFSMSAPLVEGQGNFGSIDGDGAAAMRYTEARLSEFGALMLDDIEQDTVDFADNFDGTLQEPVILPTRFPNLLVNGTSGIAVGMSTDILPHNLNEACNAVIYLASKWGKREQVTVDDLMKYIPGPDLPTGGLIYRYRQDSKTGETMDMIREAYDTGYSPVVCQAKADIEKNGKNRIVVTEIPYMVSKGSILERIAKLGKDGKFNGIISDVNDESDMEGMRIVFDIARGCDPNTALEYLFNNTKLRTSLSSNQLALVTDEEGNMYPEILSLHGILSAFINHRLTVIIRRTTFRKTKAEKRLHIVEALVKAQADIDKVIKIIKSSESREVAKTGLMKALKIDEIQANAILTTQLQHIARLEVDKLQKEQKELMDSIKEYNSILNSEEKRLAIIIEETKEINDKYHTPRRTVIVDNEGGATEAVTVADMLVPEKPQMVLLTTKGLSRVDADSYKDTTTAGKASSRAVETTLQSVVVEPADSVVLVTNTGRLWYGNVGRIDGNDIGLAHNENIVSLEKLDMSKTFVIGTRYGNVKRIKMEDITSARSEGSWGTVIGLDNDKDDAVLFASLADDSAEVMFFTAGNAEKKLDPRALHFQADQVNTVVSANAKGVTAISKIAGDPIVHGACFSGEEFKNGFVVMLTDKGFAKKIKMSEFPVQGRAGKGVLIQKANLKIGAPVALAIANAKDAIDLVSEKGKRLRINVKDIVDLPRIKNAEDIAKKFDGLFGGESVSQIALVSGVKPVTKDEVAEPKKSKTVAKGSTKTEKKSAPKSDTKSSSAKSKTAKKSSGSTKSSSTKTKATTKATKPTARSSKAKK